MSLVLFLCTGNYYRSRYAEHLFNHLAPRRGVAWRADSRGLKIQVANPGPMSRRALAELALHGVTASEPLRDPIPVTADDFARAAHVVAVKEAEHRPLILEQFPQYDARVEYWSVHDIDQATPEEALPQLTGHVEELLARLASGLKK